MTPSKVTEAIRRPTIQEISIVRLSRKAASCNRHQHSSLPLCGKGEAGLDVFLRQIGEVVEDFGNRHPGREVGEDIINGNAHAANAWPAASFARLNCD